MASASTAAEVVAALEAARSATDLANVRKRLAADEPAIGVRMGTLFEIAKSATDATLDEVGRLLDLAPFEPRMAAMCILDFKARRKLDHEGRRALYDMYLDRHDRITTWDMVDRAAPRVVGGFLAGHSTTPLRELAVSADPLRRRTATTATLFFARYGGDADVTEGFAIAGMLAGDPEPVVHNAVGIFCKHAGGRDPGALGRFLDDHAAEMARPALRLALEKSDPEIRARYLD